MINSHRLKGLNIFFGKKGKKVYNKSDLFVYSRQFYRLVHKFLKIKKLYLNNEEREKKYKHTINLSNV